MNRPTPNSDELPSTVRPRTLDIEASEMLQGNRLLAALPVGERLRLGSEMRLVELGMRGQIYDIGAVITEVYFPLNCVISVVAAVEDDVAVEVAMIGYEGMAGLPAFLGTAASPHRSFCQVPGLALRLETVTLRRFLKPARPEHRSSSTTPKAGSRSASGPSSRESRTTCGQ
jgi:hypothetical protein